MSVFAVVLPRHQKAVFPDRCVVCNAEHPGAATRIIARDNLKGRMLWLGWFTVRVPCCPACGVRLQLWRAWDFCRTLIIAGVCVAFGLIFLLPRLGDMGTGLAVLGLCCVGFLAVFIWNRFFPPVFTVDVRETHVEYEFRNGSLANEFAESNQADAGSPR
ncbi:MAG: hypothetical protein ABFD90_01210 [Phycisphaerales bacterium]